MKYEKAIDFFIKCRGLHNYFERQGGSLVIAAANAERSIKEKLSEGRDYTYSELGRLIKKLEAL